MRGGSPTPRGRWSARPPRPSESSLRATRGRLLGLGGGGARKCLDLGSPELRAGPASSRPASPSEARPAPGRECFVPRLGGRAARGALAVAETCLGWRWPRPSPAPPPPASLVPRAQGPAAQLLPGTETAPARAEVAARWPAGGEGTSLAAAAEARERVRRGQPQVTEPGPGARQGPAGTGVAGLCSSAGVLPSGFRGPRGTV